MSYYNIKESIELHKEAKKVFERSQGLSEAESTDALENLKKMSEAELNSTVRGGILTPLGLFFAENGYVKVET